MKRIFWLCSAVGLTLVHANTAAANENGRISISSGDKHLSITVATPTVSDDELNEAIARLAANSQNFGTSANQVPSYGTSTGTAYQASYAEPQAPIYSSQTTYPTIDYNTTTPTYSTNAQSVVSSLKSKLSSSAAPSVAARLASRAAHGRSQGRCAMYVRKALQAAGYQFKPQESAYMYATNGTLKSAGFVKIDKNNYEPQVGDVVVWHRTAKHPHGHIQIYNGSSWVSDFNQPKFSPYSQPGSYTVWRDARYLDASNSQGTYLALNDK